MTEEKVTNRWIMVGAALVMQLCLGILYAYSVVRGPLMKEVGYTVKQAGYPYMASLFFFAVGMIIAGRWQDKAGPSKVGIVGGVLLALGAAVAGAMYKDLGGLIFGYGVLGGLGVGFAYVTPIATCIKWFPDKRGTITGLAVFGFGAGTLVFGPLLSKMIASSGIATTFYTVSAIMLVFVCGAAAIFKVPPAGYKPAGWNPPAPAPGAQVVKTNYLPNEIIKTSSFWTLWFLYFIGAAAGLMIIGQAVPIGVEVAKLDKATAAAGLGTMALLNGSGRRFWGSVSDKLGRTKTIVACFVLYILAFVFVLPNSNTFMLWLVGVCSVGFAYGGYLALMPSLTADYFGTKSLGANYGYLFTAWGVAGVGGPFMIDFIKTQTGAFTNAMYITAGACVVGIILTLIAKPPKPVAETA
ncbi:MAG: OFA family MFS transporter [Thermoanaerobaculia bacterium]|nr:OFA family MFS transporter [Thermoanaerobaculia bacterium]